MPTPDLPQVEIAIVEMTNAARREHRLGAVERDPELTRAARGYAEFLTTSTTFSHTADGRDPTDRAKAAGYQPCVISENLSSNLDTRGFETRQLARDAVEGWMNSPGHRANLLAEHVVDIGVAVAKAPGEERYVSVQLFGRPFSLSYQFRVNNASGQTVTYAFRNESYEIRPRYMTRHTACLPGEIAFHKPGSEDVAAHYQARDGDIFVLRRQHQGVKVELVRGGEKAGVKSLR